MKTLLNNSRAQILVIIILFLAACGDGGSSGSVSGSGGGAFPGSVTGTGSGPGPGANSGVDSLIQTTIGDDDFEPNDAERDCVNALENLSTAQIQDCIDNN
jgi:hypothetical protein